MMGLLLSNWKLLAAGIVLASVFYGGWTVNGWRWESKWQTAVATQQSIVEQLRKEHERAFHAQRERDQAARESLMADLSGLREQNDGLLLRLENASLVREPEVRWRERVETDETACTPILANPFSADFVRLFNDSANRGAAMPGADPA